MADNYITIHDKNGSINISEDVLTEMVRNSILETEGVAGISAVAGAELAELIGIKNINKGLNVYMNEDVITAAAVINVKYGCNILNVARKVQVAVASSIEQATGEKNACININVSGVEFDKKSV
jgi:uncharacterized alkaline shock family protein YloU